MTSSRQVLSKTTAKTRIVKTQGQAVIPIFELLTLDIDIMDTEKFTEATIQLSLFEYQKPQPIVQFYYDLDQIQGEIKTTPKI